MFPTTRLMACATFFKRFMELKIKLIRRVARLVFQPMTVAMLGLLISADREAWECFIAVLLEWSRVFGLLSFGKPCILARITVWFSCVNIHCTLTLPPSTGSLNWYMHVVGGMLLLEAKCCGVT